MLRAAGPTQRAAAHDRDRRPRLQNRARATLAAAVAQAAAQYAAEVRPRPLCRRSPPGRETKPRKDRRRSWRCRRRRGARVPREDRSFAVEAWGRVWRGCGSGAAARRRRSNSSRSISGRNLAAYSPMAHPHSRNAPERETRHQHVLRPSQRISFGAFTPKTDNPDARIAINPVTRASLAQVKSRLS